MPPAKELTDVAQRKLLALDGGGIRGIIAIEVLEEIESTLRDELGADEGFVLADYFDYISGTSTGAIIATCLALGMKVRDVRQFYLQSGVEMFDKASVLRRFRYRYEEDRLARQLQDVIGKDTTLGTDRLRTLLMIVLRNATTDSPWTLCNNPRAKYNDLTRPDCNLNFPLWQLVRASTAAPTYFPPEVIDVGAKTFIFVDGGVTMYNNPAFQLFLMATVEPYKLCWTAGEDRMLLVSVGTGTSPVANANLQPGQMNLFYNATSIPSALMYAALNEQDFLCRTFGKCIAGDELDREVGDMINSGGPLNEKLFTYVRYNGELTHDGLVRLGLHDIVPRDVQRLDSVQHMSELQRVGRAIAQHQVRREHFTIFAD
jgi:predicted acylesterase/phospholipase RssA